MINREHKAMGEGGNSHTPMTNALRGVIKTNANVILLKLFKKYYAVNVWENTYFCIMISKGWISLKMLVLFSSYISVIKKMSLLKLNLNNQMLIHFCTCPAPNKEPYNTYKKVNKTCSQEVIINTSQVLCHPSQSTLLYKRVPFSTSLLLSAIVVSVFSTKRNRGRVNCCFISGLSNSYIILACYYLCAVTEWMVHESQISLHLVALHFCCVVF
jgi:hypothetical protein